MKHQFKHRKMNSRQCRRWNRIILAVTFLSLTVSGVLLARLGFAWFLNQRSLQTVTKVETPYKLDIKGGHGSDMTMIDLQNINMGSGITTKDFVFCVCGCEITTYIMELAHTTNIPFSYRIYEATEAATEPASGNYATHIVNGTTYFYTYSDATLVSGAYLNLNSETGLANSNGSFHNGTYSDYINVQKNAEPLYWMPDGPFAAAQSEEDAAGYSFYDYYVLQLDWNGIDSSYASSKESDMVYLMAETVGSN